MQTRVGKPEFYKKGSVPQLLSLQQLGGRQRISPSTPLPLSGHWRTRIWVASCLTHAGASNSGRSRSPASPSSAGSPVALGSVSPQVGFPPSSAELGAKQVDFTGRVSLDSLARHCALAYERLAFLAAVLRRWWIRLQARFPRRGGIWRPVRGESLDIVEEEPPEHYQSSTGSNVPPAGHGGVRAGEPLRISRPIHGAPQNGGRLAPVRITLPDGSYLTSEQDDRDAVLLRALGQQVRLESREPGQEEVLDTTVPNPGRLSWKRIVRY